MQSSFYQSVNGIERALRSNLARLPVISSFWTLVEICGDFMLPKESHALVFHEGHSTAPVHVQFQLTISFLNCMFVVARLCFARGLLHVMYP